MSTAIPTANATPKLVEQIDPNVNAHASASVASVRRSNRIKAAIPSPSAEHPADLECPHRVLPAGSDEQRQRGDQHREEVVDAVARVLEHEQPDDQAQRDHSTRYGA